MTTSLSECVLEEIAQRRRWSVWETTDVLRENLSEADTESYRAFENIFYSSEIPRGSKEYETSIAAAFKSPLYSEACKKRFAAANMFVELTLLVADKFLTEKIILSHLEGLRYKVLRLSYFAVLMGSSHLSERIVSAAIQKIDIEVKMDGVLKVIPDAMVTPRVIKDWMSNASAFRIPAGWNPESFAAQRVKQTHPEYEGFPDEWALKVFCGR